MPHFIFLVQSKHLDHFTTDSITIADGNAHLAVISKELQHEMMIIQSFAYFLLR